MSIMIDCQAEDNRAKGLDKNYTGAPQKSPNVKLSIIKLKISTPELLLPDQDLKTSQTLILLGDPLGRVMIGLIWQGY